MNALVVGLSLDDLEDLVWGICVDLVHGECHIFYIKDSNFGASW